MGRRNNMQINVEYSAQVKRAAGVGRERVELAGPATLGDLAACVADLHGDELKAVLLDGDGNVHPSILVFVGDEQVRAGDGCALADGDVVAFLSPISGG
ncbi:MAG: MoaD/ThiS family protein [Planctomycetaceae bacterium]